jgi:hypothetical protein
MEQLVARRAHNPKVVGSSPAPATESDKLENSSFVRFFFAPNLLFIKQIRVATSFTRAVR